MQTVSNVWSSSVEAIPASSSAIRLAVEQVQLGKMTYGEAAAAYKVRKSTIHKLHKVVSDSAGRPRVLSVLEETVVVRCCLVLASFGYPANRAIVGNVISHYLQQCGRSSHFNGIPGRKWWSGFLKRSSEIAERENRTFNCATSSFCHSCCY